ncbi:ATP-dependent DNA helicase sgs1, partial [Actinomortierella ambigua]
MEQHQRTLDNLGVPNVVFNQESPLLHESLQALENGHIRAIIATPEFVFLNKKFKTLWDSTSWHSRLMAVVIDEAHCVINWGDSFRPFYSRVGELRTLASAPLISVSATLSPRDVRELTDKLHLDGDASMVVNVGNNRPNVYLEVRKLPHASVEGLQFLLDFAKTIIYVDQRMMTVKILFYLWSLKPAETEKVAVYHSLMSPEYKSAVMRRFIEGDIK